MTEPIYSKQEMNLRTEFITLLSQMKAKFTYEGFADSHVEPVLIDLLSNPWRHIPFQGKRYPHKAVQQSKRLKEFGKRSTKLPKIKNDDMLYAITADGELVRRRIGPVIGKDGMPIVLRNLGSIRWHVITPDQVHVRHLPAVVRELRQMVKM